MSSPSYPAIPMPTPTVDSLLTTIMALKETVELLTGQSGTPNTTAATLASVSAVQTFGVQQLATTGTTLAAVSAVANAAAAATALETTNRIAAINGEATTRANADTTLTNSLTTINTLLNSNYTISGTLAAGVFGIDGVKTIGVATQYPVSYMKLDKLAIGGLTAAYPAIMRNASKLAIRTADNSADADMSASTTQSITIYNIGTIPAPAGLEGTRVSVSDGTSSGYNTGYVGGGALHTSVYSTGAAWVYV